ncbi:MAG: chorismate-binding protein, partial [Fimbriimonadales bacterium]
MRPPLALVRWNDLEGGVCWLHGSRLAGVITARRCSEVLPALVEVERATQKGLSAIGFVAYEAAHGFDRAFPEAQTGLPLVWFALVDLAVLKDEREVLQAHLAEVPSCGLAHESWSPTLTRRDYQRALKRIRDYIAAGDVYQVNYSFRLRAPFAGDPFALFWERYHAQPVPYAAYIDAGEHVILSLSPELFLALDGESVVSRPMKGTAPRGLLLEDDIQQAQALRWSEKNRA